MTELKRAPILPLIPESFEGDMRVFAEDLLGFLKTQAQATRDKWDMTFTRTWSSGAAAPTTGTWAQGDVCWNTGPAAEGKVGWVCVVAGSPGTWKAFGVIDA